MIHKPFISLCVNDEVLAAARVWVQEGSDSLAVGVVELGGLSFQSHHITAHDLANGLRKLAQKLDREYDSWLRAKSHDTLAEAAGGGVS